MNPPDYIEAFKNKVNSFHYRDWMSKDGSLLITRIHCRLNEDYRRYKCIDRGTYEACNRLLKDRVNMWNWISKWLVDERVATHLRP